MTIRKIKNVDVLMPSKSQYEVLHHFTRKLYEAFLRAGYNCRLLEGDDRILVPVQKPPDLSICFNGAPRDESGNFLCDILSVPHISCLIDPPFHFFDLTQSKYMFLTCDDRFCVETVRALNFPRVAFMPHAVEADFKADPRQERIYDVVFLATFIDYEGRRAEWKKNLPKEICKAMDQACEETLADETTSFMWSLQKYLGPLVWGKNPPYKLDAVVIIKIFEEVELFIKGKDREDLIKSIHDAQIHLFGTSIDELNWKSRFKNASNIVSHPAVSYLEALEIMKQTKIVLNSSIKNKEGAHERIFTGLAAGALVITNQNAYVEELFNNHEGLILYKRSHFQDINGQVNHFLSNENERRRDVEKGSLKVSRNHTWDHRVKKLMKDIAPFL